MDKKHLISVLDEDKKAEQTSPEHNYGTRNSWKKSVTNVFKSIMNYKKNRSNPPQYENIDDSDKKNRSNPPQYENIDDSDKKNRRNPPQYENIDDSDKKSTCTDYETQEAKALIQNDSKQPQQWSNPIGDFEKISTNGYYQDIKVDFEIRAKLLIHNEPKQPHKWSTPITCKIQISHGVMNGLQNESFISIFPVSASNSLNISSNEALITHTIQPEYKLKDSFSDDFNLPESLNLDEEYVYQRCTITRTREIEIGLIFGTEENKKLFELNFRKGQLYNENQRRGV